MTGCDRAGASYWWTMTPELEVVRGEPQAGKYCRQVN